MSPEVLAGIGYGCDVDVWAFGVFIFELLVGTTPFATEGNESSTLRVFDNVLKKPLAFPAGDAATQGAGAASGGEPDPMTQGEL